MNNKQLMNDFINSLNSKNKLTKFFKIIFNYEVLNDYNYISRFVNENNCFIIDIYDNILDNRFNRYIFDYISVNYVIKIDDSFDVIITSIAVNSKYNPDNNLMKLAYLFSNNNNVDIIDYAKTFLPIDIVNILIEVIKK